MEDDEELDDAELNLDKVEEEMAADYSEEEEEEILHIDALQHVRKLPHIYSRNFIVELVPYLALYSIGKKTANIIRGK